MAKTYLGSDADALDGFEFLTMAEAGEVGHWGVVAEMAKNAKQPRHAGARALGARRSRSGTSTRR